MIKLKDLGTEEGRREYYRYDPSDPTTIKPRQAPYLDPRFNQILLEEYGTDIWGDQLIRIAWSGDLKENRYYEEAGKTYAYEGCKYPFMRISVLTGYQYTGKNGKPVLVPDRSLVPEGKPFLPITKKIDLPKLHFVVEMKFTIDQLVAMGWAPDPDNPAHADWGMKNGLRYVDPPGERGAYILAYPVVTADNEYRDVTDADLMHIATIVNRAKTETDAEYAVRQAEERQKIQVAQELEEFERQLDAIDQAIVAGQKKLAKGRVLYSK